MGGSLERRGALGACSAALAVAALALPAAASAAPAPLATLGSAGVGAGQLASPTDVAVDASGLIYVAEFNNNRISVFNPDGTFSMAFGDSVIPGPPGGLEVCTTATTCQAGFPGGAAGQLQQPDRLAFDAAGRLYVADRGNKRIDVFNTSPPSFVNAFGWGVDTGASAFEVCTTASTCQGGSIGGGAGQFNTPKGMEVDGSGTLYVIDQLNQRVNRFTTSPPAFIDAFGFGVDTGASAFEVCTTASTCQAGTFSGAAGGLASPSGLALDGSGRLFVADTTSHRVSQFSVSGPPAFTQAFGYGVDTGSPTTFQICTTASTCQQGIAGGAAGQLLNPEDVALDGSGALLVDDTSNYRVSQFATAAPGFTQAYGFGVDTGAAAFQICTIASTCQGGLSGSGTGQLNNANGMTTDCRGAIWIADDSNQRVQRFGEPGTASLPCPAPPDNEPKPKCGGKTATIAGTSGADNLKGTKRADVIASVGGNDRVRGLAGNDLLCGGPGRDQLIGGGGRDTLLGQAGRDTLRGGPGHDKMRGGPGLDKQVQ